MATLTVKSFGIGRVLAAVMLALTVMLTVQPSAADASVSRGTGGYASTNLYINTTYHTFSYWTSIYSDYGASQDIGFQLQIYNPRTGKWSKSAWQQCTTLRNGLGSQCSWRTAPVTLPAGRYYFRFMYGWYTTAGWQLRYDDERTDPYLGWRWV